MVYVLIFNLKQLIMITTNNDLGFLQQKITEIKSALFKAEINSVLQLPNNIVSTLKMDDDGYIWFFTSCNGYYAGKIDKHFFGHLEFYQKGSDYHIKVSGKALIVDDADVIKKDNSFYNDSNIALIKFKILQAEYFENKHPQAGSFKEWIKDYFTELFVPKSHRLFNFPETA